MFGAMTAKFQDLFSSLTRKKLTDENISDAVRQVRLALLDADVNYTVATAFIKRIKDEVVGQELIKKVEAGDQFIKIIHDELVKLMGGEEPKVDLKGNPSVLLLCGLQGSGKTTTAAKLALYFKKKPFHKNPLIIACDLQRAAAIDQLKTLGAQLSIPIFALEGEKDAVKVAKAGLEEAKNKGYDLVIVDTAGRLHIDEDLMKELEAVKKLTNPAETLFVAPATMGQDAVKTAAEFDKRIEISGSILTMLDGNARAGAAISILEVTQKPLKFEGVGEKPEDFQLFNPESMADRILGMGDVINLVKKAEEHFEEEASEELEKKIRKASFTFTDYLKQMGSIKKMGSIKGLLKMLPGFSELGDLDMSEKEFKKLEAMILSMTPKERECLDELTPSRRRRIASGSGAHIDDVNRMAKGFKRIKQLFKSMPTSKKKLKGELGAGLGMFDKFF